MERKGGWDGEMVMIHENSGLYAEYVGAVRRPL